MRYKTQSGSALVYILIAIALLAALTALIMKPSTQQATSQRGFNVITELNTQIAYARSAIDECVVSYQKGDDGLVGTPNFPYPINPSSTYLDSPSADDELANIRCPGNPGGGSKDHAQIFGGSSGKFLPPAPNLFESWTYYSGPDGVFFYTSTDKTDPFLKTSLQKLDDQYSECEADIIDASSGNVQLLSSGGTPVCPSGSVCFRLWVIANPSAVYNGDTDGEELIANCP